MVFKNAFLECLQFAYIFCIVVCLENTYVGWPNQNKHFKMLHNAEHAILNRMWQLCFRYYIWNVIKKIIKKHINKLN